MNALREQFIVETRELILQATDDLIALERDGFGAERVDRIFRAFHTLKGSAGVVELPPIGVTMHAAEDLAAEIRARKLQASRAVISQVLACLDQISRWVDAFETQGLLPSRASDEARIMSERLRGQLSQNAESAATQTAATIDGLPDWVPRLIEAEHERIVQAVGDRPAVLVAIAYEPHAGCFFDGDDPLRLLRQIPSLLALQVELRGGGRPLAELDPFACSLRLYAIAAADRSAISVVFRLVPDQVRIVEVPAGALERKPARPDDGGVAALVRAVVAEQRQVLAAAGPGEDLTGRIGAAARAAANALLYGRRQTEAERVANAGSAAMAAGDAAPLLDAIDETLDSLAVAQPSGTTPASRPAPERQAEEAEAPASRWLRVDQSRVDALVNLAGELIVQKNSFAHLAKRIEGEVGSEDLSLAVRREQEAIERLASDMHAAIMGLRMVPIAQVLGSFPRLVRDLSQRLGKDVRLLTRGETTESDKAVVDRLFEPLLHLVRNALDHGIETPEERRAAGKGETASLTLAASRVGDRVVIEVGDDGRGIDPAVIRRKAHERGLLTSEAAASLSDDAAVDLIFFSGVSTAAAVSDISGRGVGMDAVRAAVDAIGGRVSLASRVGAGTNVRLDLPVTIATSRIMVVECAGQAFGIALDDVAETVRLTADRVRRIKNNEGFVFRDRTVPICSLAELLRLPSGQPAASGTRLMIVMETGGSTVGVEVDAIRDRLDVVLKPMQGLLCNARGYAGTTLLGDGTVLLVVDLKEMLP